MRFKVCCIADVEEAQLAIRYGASAVGLVSKMPSGPGPIPKEKIAGIAACIPPGVASFLLTSLQDAGEIIAQHWRCRTSTIQIVDELVSGSYTDIREALPGIKIVQVIHVTGAESLAEAKRIAPQVDALLLDSGDQSKNIKELGGTGRVHDWKISRQIVESCDAPVFLAGGLNPVSVSEAVLFVRPFGVDVCSGLRSNGRLDERKLAAFVKNLAGD